VSAHVRRALEEITRIRGVRGAVLADRTEGIVVAESAMLGVRREAIAALGASLVRRCGVLLEGGGLGVPRHVLLQGREGTLVAVPVTDELLLLAVGDAAVNVGLVRAELQRVARELR
jgi:predicted regulator of Ras-like GTPase activity (Roadblock/LC7/MglB family)